MQVFDPERWGPTKEDPQPILKASFVYVFESCK